MFGYDPRSYYRGRGAFESLGAGLKMKPGEIAFKCTFATIDDASGIVKRRRCDRNFEAEGPVLCDFLDSQSASILPSFPENRVRIKYATEHRCGVVIEGPGLCDRISGTDPLKDDLALLAAMPLDGSEKARNTARVVNECSDGIRNLLSAHPINEERVKEGKSPANCVLLRGCGELLDVEAFQTRHGFHACMVAPTKVIAGIGCSLGIQILQAPGATGDYHTKLTPKVDAIAAALDWADADADAAAGGDQCRLGFLHVKATDDAGHDGDVDLKRDLIAACDAMVGQLVAKLWEQEKKSGGKKKYYVCCTGDHSTPAKHLKDHSHEPVPFAAAPVSEMVRLAGGEEGLAACAPSECIKLPYQVEEGRKRKCQEILVEKSAELGSSGDSVVKFSEVAAAEGSLGRFPGSQIIPLLSSLFR